MEWRRARCSAGSGTVLPQTTEVPAACNTGTTEAVQQWVLSVGNTANTNGSTPNIINISCNIINTPYGNLNSGDGGR
jgi:hypothetical protein